MSTERFASRINEITPENGYTKDMYKDSVIAMDKIEYESFNNGLSNYKHNAGLLLNQWARIMVAFETLPHIKNMNDLDEVLQVLEDRDKLEEIAGFIYEESFERLGM